MNDPHPSGWTTAYISDLTVALESGSRPRGGVRGVESGVPSIGGEHLQYDGSFDFSSIRYVPRDFAARMTRGHIQTNDILIVKDGATTGKMSFVDSSFPYRDAVVNEHVFVCRLTHQLEPRFVFHFLSSNEGQQRLLDNFQGSAQGGINQSFAANTEIPVAPLPEQIRIVSALNTLLPRVVGVQQRLARVPRVMKQFRRSVLSAACSGRLTADWRENHPSVEPANELFETITATRKRSYESDCSDAVAMGKRRRKNPNSNERSRNLIGELPEIPDTWHYYRLEELCHLVTDGTHRTPTYQAKGIPFLSVKNVRPFLVRDSDVKFISQKEHKQISARCNPESGDILYTKIGATFGYAALVNVDYSFSIFVSLALLKPVTPHVNSAFTEIVMNSDIVFCQARERVSGIGTPDLHLVEIRDFRIPLPPKKEQQEIVRRVRALFALADQIEARYREARKRVDGLPRSILAKAFRGDLVPTEAELAEAEGRSFESAEELLQRIQSSKTTQPKKKYGTNRPRSHGRPSGPTNGE